MIEGNENKYVLITGCSSGIGFESATFLKKRGYRVIASCRQQKDMGSLKKAGLEHVIQLDLSDSLSIQRAVAQTFCDESAIRNQRIWYS